MTKNEKRREFCGGCRNDFYNGNNDLGVKECWSLKTARISRVAFVHLDSVPPWHAPIVRTLHCHQRERYVRINPGHPQLASRKARATS